jgi:hypothetical protein
MLPTCAKRMWTFAAKIKSQYVDNLLSKCQNMWTFVVKIDNKYVDNLMPKCQKICGLLLQNGKKMRGY